jgi:uncharacterized protein (TIGR00369 family)
MNKEQVSHLVKKFENLPYHQFIGLKIVSYNPGFCETQVDISENILAPDGVVHGGIYYSICDITAGIAASTMLSDGSRPVTSDINVSVLSAAREGILKTTANVLKAGKRICFVEAKIVDKNENLVAVARITKAILNNPGVSK